MLCATNNGLLPMEFPEQNPEILSGCPQPLCKFHLLPGWRLATSGHHDTRNRHLVQTAGTTLVKSSVHVHLAHDTKDGTSTALCGCGIKWPERRGSYEKTEATELGELRECER